MTQQTYGQFCPVSMAAEILCTRWTMLILRELVSGTTRFNELRRGVPRMSPALLSQRLKELEAAGIISKTAVPMEANAFEYRLTGPGQELEPLVMAFGKWGQRWVKSELSLQHLDGSLLMWDMRRNINIKPMPKKRSVIQFMFPEQPRAERNYWLIVEPDGGTEVDLCQIDPGFNVDLYVSTDLRSLTAIWMGLDKVSNALADNRMILTGDRDLETNMQAWLGLSPFASVENCAV